MIEANYKAFFESLCTKKIIGHNPVQGAVRFLLYDPDFLDNWAKFDLQITHFCFLLSRPDLSIPVRSGADQLNHPCSFLIIRATDNTQTDIDAAMRDAEQKALKFWAKLRFIQEENFHLFDQITLGDAEIKIEKIKGLSDCSAGVEVMMSLKELINYTKFYQENDWI